MASQDACTASAAGASAGPEQLQKYYVWYKTEENENYNKTVRQGTVKVKVKK